MSRRVNEVQKLAGRVIPITERLTVKLTAAQACRAADFELRTGMKIEAAILSFLDDELFNTSVPYTEGVGSAPKSHGRDE
jgi:hypothetical protein